MQAYSKIFVFALVLIGLGGCGGGGGDSKAKPLKVRYEPNIYYGINLKVRPDASVAEGNAELQPLLQDFSRHSPARYPDTFRVHDRIRLEVIQ